MPCTVLPRRRLMLRNLIEQRRASLASRYFPSAETPQKAERVSDFRGAVQIFALLSSMPVDSWTAQSLF
jgi:hypothetical protein